MALNPGGVAVITGGAGGIGLALARELAVVGMRPVLLDQNASRLDAAAAELPGSIAVVVDVSDPDSVNAAARRCLDLVGPASVICANAGISSATGPRLWELPPAAWERVYRVNVLGVVNTLRSFIPQILQVGRGHVQITASMAAVSTGGYLSPYFSSKHAVLSIAETLRLQLRKQAPSVGVSVLLPSRVKTNIDETHDGDFEPAAIVPPGSNMISPEVVASRTTAAMAAGDFYVFTHPNSLGRIEDWYLEISAAAAAAAKPS
jgi:NAD(P)-dependent dehydrogenase (short-subunit alcohol dehydrogenase family)